MKETKVYVNKLPTCCCKCEYYHENCADGFSCSKLGYEIHANFTEGGYHRYQDCPLHLLPQAYENMWQELKEWLEEELYDCKQLIDPFCNELDQEFVKFCYKKLKFVLEKMRELEKGENK